MSTNAVLSLSCRTNLMHFLFPIQSDVYFHHIWNILKVLISCRKFWFYFWSKHVFYQWKVTKREKSNENFPSVTLCSCRHLWQKFVPHLQPRPLDLESWNFSSRRSLLGQLYVLNNQNYEVQVPNGPPLVKIFEILSGFNGFHGLIMVLSCL
jgi:hypothetical protein